MDVVAKIIENAKAKQLVGVFSEGYDSRIVKAAYEAVNDGVLKESIIIATKDEAEKAAGEVGVDLSKLTIVNPVEDSKFQEYAEEFVEIRKKKGISLEQAKEVIKDNLYYAAMMVRNGRADVSVNGAVYSTGKVIVSAAQVLGTEKNVDVISSSFLMVVPDYLGSGVDTPLVYGDCGVIPNPSPSELASIAYSCANMYKKLVGGEPKVGMLSFSTMGSGKHSDVDKVVEAVKIAKERYPELELDGELQLDAAIVPSIGERKAPNSKVAGNANVLIFPDLDAGNIGYKLTERMAKATALGPILQGVSKPFMDLSRGCKWEDVYKVAAIAVNLA